MLTRIAKTTFPELMSLERSTPKVVDLRFYIDEPVEIRQISATETWSLRHQVLRPNQRLKYCEYPNDFNPYALHLGAYVDGILVGVTSVFREGLTPQDSLDVYRLRGMAVLPPFQSKGIGSRLICGLQQRMRERSATTIWCNARTTASNFYARLGFDRKGQEFDIPGIGPHYIFEWCVN